MRILRTLASCHSCGWCHLVAPVRSQGHASGTCWCVKLVLSRGMSSCLVLFMRQALHHFGECKKKCPWVCSCRGLAATGRDAAATCSAHDRLVCLGRCQGSVSQTWEAHLPVVSRALLAAARRHPEPVVGCPSAGAGSAPGRLQRSHEAGCRAPPCALQRAGCHLTLL